MPLLTSVLVDSDISIVPRIGVLAPSGGVMAIAVRARSVLRSSVQDSAWG
jgi:hypothetical protein